MEENHVRNYPESGVVMDGEESTLRPGLCDFCSVLVSLLELAAGEKNQREHMHIPRNITTLALCNKSKIGSPYVMNVRVAITTSSKLLILSFVQEGHRSEEHTSELQSLMRT